MTASYIFHVWFILGRTLSIQTQASWQISWLSFCSDFGSEYSIGTLFSAVNQLCPVYTIAGNITPMVFSLSIFWSTWNHHHAFSVIAIGRSQRDSFLESARPICGVKSGVESANPSGEKASSYSPPGPFRKVCPFERRSEIPFLVVARQPSRKRVTLVI